MKLTILLVFLSVASWSFAGPLPSCAGSFRCPDGSDPAMPVSQSCSTLPHNEGTLCMGTCGAGYMPACGLAVCTPLGCVIKDPGGCCLGTCTSDGSCDAPAPACGDTTTGTDNCGMSCTKTGAACACTPDGSCSAAVPACGTTTWGVDNCGGSCSKVGSACACVPNGSCSAPAPACGTTTSGVDNCGTVCTKTGAACACLPAPLTTSNVAPTAIGISGTYSVTCNYGGPSCINAVPSLGSCAFAGASGTGAQFNCTAPASPGAVTVSCLESGCAGFCATPSSVVGSVNVLNNAGCGFTGICGKVSTSENSGATNLANYSVELRDDQNSLIKVTMTDASGNYSFHGLAAGNSYGVDVLPARNQTANPGQIRANSIPTTGWISNFLVSGVPGTLQLTGCQDQTFVLVSTFSTVYVNPPASRPSSQGTATFTAYISGSTGQMQLPPQVTGETPYFVYTWVPHIVTTPVYSESYVVSNGGAPVELASSLAPLETLSVACP